ncbi:hypothetical protein M9H77_33818 [Catharanthus roseus]|uniref:Uncharacterized protein n=1 Tax=Catharanthus roseus TaxID=4058 RepID=A0ACB9ZL83_CATRO|nr:hypothetical protein M9H77_33818 [Catharanthus roseus]
MSNGQGSIINEGEPLVILTNRESGLMPVIDDMFSNSYHMLYRRHTDQNVLAKLTEMVKDEEVAQRVWTSQVLYFGVEITNQAESEHSVLKLWLSMCHGDLDTVFLNIDSLIQGQITEIKYTLEISKLKEKYGAKSNPIVKNLSNKISHLGLKKIMDELKKARQMRKLEIGSDILEEHDRDMESEMRDLTSLLKEISTGPISNVREVRRLIKCVIYLVLPNDPCHPLSTSLETAVTKERRKTNSTKRKIRKSSGSGFGSGSGSGSGSNPSPRGRGRPPSSGRGGGRGRTSCRSSLSSVVNPNSPSVPFPFNNAFPEFMYEFIQNWKNVVGDGNCGFRIVSNFG